MSDSISEESILYDSTTVFWVRAVYFLMLIVWIVLCSYSGMWTTPASPVLILPFFTFGIAIYFTDKLSTTIEEFMSKASYLSLGVILAVPLLSWISQETPRYSQIISTCIIVALVLSLATYIDVWIGAENISIYRHFRSSLQVMSVTLIIYVLSMHCLLKESNVLWYNKNQKI